MGTISFYPWAKTSSKITTSFISLTPFDLRATNVFTQAEDNDVRGVLANYFNRSNQQLKHVTILKLNSKELVNTSLTSNEVSEIMFASDFVTMAALTNRPFFKNHNYWNSSNLIPVVQNFSASRYTPSIESRRRCIPLLTGYLGNVFKETAPHHVSLGNNITIDVPLLDALIKYFDPQFQTIDWMRYLEAIQLFNSSNTDNPSVSENTELISICSAFERILNCRNGKERQLRANFMTSVSNIPIPQGLNINRNLSDLSQYPLREAFITDLFRLRGNLAHGILNNGYQSIWSQKELLLLAAYIFPYVLKYVLASDHLYDLTNNDKVKVFIFDYLLAESNLYSYNQKQNSYSWNNAEQNGLYGSLGIDF